MAEHITDKGADAIEKSSKKRNRRSRNVPGPSDNPQTNLLMQDIFLRSVGRLGRHTLEKGLLRRRYSDEQAKKIVENRSMVQTLAAYGVTKLATRSVPGALLVGGGLLAKTLFDRSQSRRKARREGDRELAEQAEQ